MADTHIPTYTDLMWPTVTAIRSLGGSGRIDEISEAVIDREGYTEEQQAVRRRPDDNITMLEYRLSWARNYLKNSGVVENSARGVWALTEFGQEVTEGQLPDLVREWKRKMYQARKDGVPEPTEDIDLDETRRLENRLDRGEVGLPWVARGGDGRPPRAPGVRVTPPAMFGGMAMAEDLRPGVRLRGSWPASRRGHRRRHSRQHDRTDRPYLHRNRRAASVDRLTLSPWRSSRPTAPGPSTPTGALFGWPRRLDASSSPTSFDPFVAVTLVD